MRWIKIVKTGECYPARSTAFDNWNVERRKRFGASLHSGPLVLFPPVVARVALDQERRVGRSGAIMWRPSGSDAVSVLSEVVVVVVRVVVLLTSVTECFPSSSRSASRYLHRRTKVYKRKGETIYSSINHSFIICPMAIAYSIGQIIKSVCVSVCPSVGTLTVAFLDRFSPKLAQT